MTLDDPKVLSKFDRSRMLPQLEKIPERLRSLDTGSIAGFRKAENVVFGGVGGSGIVGDILTDFSKYSLPIPTSVCRSIRIPNTVGESTLFVAISYSGDTQETLGMLRQARERGAQSVTVTSGGEMLTKSQKESIPCVTVPSGMLPRVALPELLAAAVSILGATGLLRNAPSLLHELAKVIAGEIDAIGPNIPEERNRAKQMARALLGKVPLLIGNDEDASVLRRFKNELNENSKMPAFYYTIPEAYHDDIEGLQSLGEMVDAQPIVLISQNESRGQKRTREGLYRLLAETGFPEPIEFQEAGDDRLIQLMTAITFGDFVSVYLAALRGVDPSEMRLIPKFKQFMRA